MGEWDVVTLTRKDVNLLNQSQVHEFMGLHHPDIVVHAAAKVGGIQANIDEPYRFISENLTMDSNLISSSVAFGVQSFMYIGSSCMYPMNYRQPLVESDILAAPLEPTNEGYAIAKIAGSKQCQYISEKLGLNYKTIIPSNLYGPGDNFNPDTSHLLASAIRKVGEAKEAGLTEVDVWGDGKAFREFTYVCDVTDWIAGHLDAIDALPNCLNLGSGLNKNVFEYYEAVSDALGYGIQLKLDPTRPSGMQSKLMDSSLARSRFNWSPTTDLKSGISATYEWMLGERNYERI
jgi:GDP-L-fucose synthase